MLVCNGFITVILTDKNFNTLLISNMVNIDRYNIHTTPFGVFSFLEGKVVLRPKSLRTAGREVT